MTEKRAWVTLATNDSYALGAMVLGNSLKLVNTVNELAVLVTPGVSPSMRLQLATLFNLIEEVDVLDSKDAANLALLGRPELGVTFTKLHCWTLTQYAKCVFLDADTLIVQNCDELFEREELSAVPDVGWPDCFNSGVFVFKPSNDTFKALLDFALVNGSFDGGDQGLLNLYFKDWMKSDKQILSFTYNMVATGTYSYLPAFKHFQSQVKVVHFIGSNKPWLQCGPACSTLSGYLELWWNIFNGSVSKHLSTEMINNCTVFGDEPKPHSCTPPPSPESDLRQRHTFVYPWELPLEQLNTLQEHNDDIMEQIVTHILDKQGVKHCLQTEQLENSTFGPFREADSNRLQNTRSPPPIRLHRMTKNTNSFQVEQTNTIENLKYDSNSQTTMVDKRMHNDLVSSNLTYPIAITSSVVDNNNLRESCEAIPCDIQETYGESGLAGALAGGEKTQIEDQWRKQNWEQGNVDYAGKDSFDNIWKKISATVGISAQQTESQTPAPVDASVGVKVEVPLLSQEPPKPETQGDAPTVDAAKVQESPKVEAATVPEAPKADMTVPETTKAEATSAAESPQNASTTVPEVPKTEAPATLEAPKVDAPTTPDAPIAKEEAPATPETPKAEVAATSEAPKAEGSTTAEQPKADDSSAPEAPKTDVPVAIESPAAEKAPKSDVPVVPETPKAEAPLATETSKVEAPESPKAEGATPTPPEAPKEEVLASSDTPKADVPAAVPEDKPKDCELCPMKPKEGEACCQKPTEGDTCCQKPKEGEDCCQKLKEGEVCCQKQKEGEVCSQNSKEVAAAVQEQTKTDVAEGTAKTPETPKTEESPQSTEVPKTEEPKTQEPPKTEEAPKTESADQPKPEIPPKPETPKGDKPSKPAKDIKSPVPLKDGEAEIPVPVSAAAAVPVDVVKEGAPGSPTVTSPTPATPGSPLAPPFPEEAKLQVAPTEPQTPPVATSSEAPIPPKRKGNPKAQNGKQGKSKK